MVARGKFAVTVPAFDLEIKQVGGRFRGLNGSEISYTLDELRIISGADSHLGRAAKAIVEAIEKHEYTPPASR